ncbi:MAG TPA: wax ester/triacylglycerol synthase family O-acyltransferase [Solirubrobacteraceae bacterium]|nr:wax ester/triacylglycerol synthase family O-acyltransferase [Solirubrobacteraceae bacterium]
MSTHMSSADAAWLHMDRPTNLMVINSVLLFDEPVDWERVKQVTQERLVDRYPKFRQRVVESRLPLQAPRWEDDPDFALQHHMHHLALAAPGDAAALQELVGDLMTTPLDRNRPLWHEYMVDGFGEGAALIVRMHHCIADGIALARVMLSLADSQPDAGISHGVGKPRTGSSRIVLGGLPVPGTRPVKRVLGLAEAAVRQTAHVATSPEHAVRLGGAIGREAVTGLRLLLTPADAASAIKGDPGVSRRVAWTQPVSLKRVKRIARDHDATVNDVLLAAVSGGLRHYLQDRGGGVHEIQAMVPFNLRPLDEPLPRELGNKFGLVFVPLPVGVSGSFWRLREVQNRMREIKRSRDGAVSYELLSLTGITPEPIERRIVDLFSGKGTAVMTNVPGPKEPVYLAGSPIRSVLFWAPTSGHIGMSVSIFSYRGEVTVGLMVDAALVPDPGEIVKQLERELEALAKSTGRSGRESRGPRAASTGGRGRGGRRPERQSTHG